MPRQLRLEYAGAIYHVMNRGDRREVIVRDGRDRERFLALLGTRGAIAARTGGAPALRGAVRECFWGSLAMALTA
jgi:hypothetical protein